MNRRILSIFVFCPLIRTAKIVNFPTIIDISCEICYYIYVSKRRGENLILQASLFLFQKDKGEKIWAFGEIIIRKKSWSY